jgi:hypothetical protein
VATGQHHAIVSKDRIVSHVDLAGRNVEKRIYDGHSAAEVKPTLIAVAIGSHHVDPLERYNDWLQQPLHRLPQAETE